MGIGLTLQQVEGWEGQFERMERFLKRTYQARVQGNGSDEMDFALVLFQQSLALRDWIHIACPSVRKQLEELFESSVELKLCRDIANGFKHMKLSRKASIDNAFSIVFEYNPILVSKGEMVVLAGGYKFTLLAVATECVEQWRRFIIAVNLEPCGLARKVGETHSLP
jgi:hypothetical protein